MTTTPQRRSFRHLFGTAVLATQVFVIAFAGLAAYGLQLAPSSTVWLIVGFGVTLCLAALATMRHVLGQILGSLVQILMTLSGLVIGMMWFLGGVFAVLWLIGLILGTKIDREKAAYAAAVEE